MTPPRVTADIRVDRITLRAGPMSEADARRLAELVALALGRLPMPPKPVDAGTLRIDVPQQAGQGLTEIADAMAAAVEAALRVEAVS
jgi:hypothetical protein